MLIVTTADESRRSQADWRNGEGRGQAETRDWPGGSSGTAGEKLVEPALPSRSSDDRRPALSSHVSVYRSSVNHPLSLQLHSQLLHLVLCLLTNDEINHQVFLASSRALFVVSPILFWLIRSNFL